MQHERIKIDGLPSRPSSGSHAPAWEPRADAPASRGNVLSTDTGGGSGRWSGQDCIPMPERLWKYSEPPRNPRVRVGWCELANPSMQWLATREKLGFVPQPSLRRILLQSLERGNERCEWYASSNGAEGD